LRFRKTLSNWLNNRYLLIIRNEENFAEKSSINFTYAKVVLISVIIVIAVFIMSLFLVRTLLAQWFDPEYEQLEANRKLLVLANKVDSLEQDVAAKDVFIKRIQFVLSGDSIDDFQSIAQSVESAGNAIEPLKTDELAPIDSQFREEFENMDISSFSVELVSELEETFLFSPITGYVSSQYNLKEDHFGVDIVAKPNEPVKCVADGTVIFADWTQEFGYVLAIQHRDNLISVYKHNAQLLKKVGNFVGGGEIIAIIGNSGELTDGPHLHFELWYNGTSLNPEEFVLF